LFKVEIDHVVFVANLKMFFRHFNRRICFNCYKTFSPRYKHVCKNICFSCRRTYLSKSAQFSSDPFFEYCDVNIELKECLDIPIECPKCHGYSWSAHCRKGHIQICAKSPDAKGRAGYFCPDCGDFSYSPFPNAEIAKLKHSCNPTIKNCKACGAVLGQNHQCLIKQEVPTSKWPNLAFLAFSYKFSSQCKECFDIKETFCKESNLTWSDVINHENYDTLVCKRHNKISNFDPEPNLAVIYKEIERGIFKQYVVTEDLLNLSPCEEKIISCPYYSKTFNGEKPFLLPDTTPKKFTGLEISRKNLKGLKNKTMIQNFLLLVTQPEFQNTTFLSFNANNSSNQTILKGLLEIDLIPFVIQKGNKVNLISVEFLNLRFLNASAFIVGGLEEWCTMYELENNLHYFPEK